MNRPCVLVFAGMDPSGGAGIQADILAISAMGAHPLPVVTVLTAQDNDRVFSVHPVAPSLLLQQTQPLMDKFDIAAVKIGIVGNRDNAEAIARIVRKLRLQRPDIPVVLDPVLASGHGDPLAAEDAMLSIASLLRIATIVTPNVPEAIALSGGDRRTDSQAEFLLTHGCRNVLIKGGHAADEKVINRWFTEYQSRSWIWPRLPGTFHGSGCTLAAALAALLARGKSMAEALEQSQAYCHQTLAGAYSIAEGQSIPDRLAARGKE